MDLKFRKLYLKDLPRFLELFNTVLTKDFPEYRPRVTKIYKDYIFNKKYFINLIKERKNCILGAFENNKLVGSLSIYGHNHGGVVELLWLVVDKNFRNKGIGTKLLQEAEKWAFRNKFHHLFFHTENLEHVEFYKKRGYEYVGLERKAWFGIDEHLLQKILREEPFEEIFKRFKI